MENLKVLIVGGGIGGMATAIVLARQGLTVELIDLDPHWRVYGAGITITGVSLRAYRRLGLLDQIKSEGAVTRGSRLCHYSGHLIGEFDEPVLEDGLPATGGILRPILHKIMSQEVRDLGVPVRLGLTVDRLDQDADGVNVTFSDGGTGRYDLVVAADGINSKTRSLLFANAPKPRYTGQASWRVVADRPQGFDKNEFYVGHKYMVGIIATSATSVYTFLLHSDPDRTRIAPENQLPKIRELLSDFGGNVKGVRDGLGPQSSIVYRPLETVLQPKPWHIGRAILIGDAAHATTPHLASGAGMAVEDALVLAEELGRSSSVERALAVFTERRFERCRFVVESSVAIGEAQLAGSTDEVARMMSQALVRLAEEF